MILGKYGIIPENNAEKEVIMLHFLLTLSDTSNHEKIEHIYYTYHDYMMKYAVSKFRSFGRTNCVYDAEDAVQSTFMKITRHIDKIDFSRGEKDIKNYCLSILCNEIYNVLNGNKEEYELLEDFSDEKEYHFIEELEIKECYAQVVKAIEALDEKYSTTLYLVYCKEKTVNEIAEMMGISVKTVYTRLTRGKQLLISSLKGAGIYG